ncbi:NifU family protein [Sphingomicrobium sp. XHP0235]|uniref:NifU family protein n=1 Tax=Sphingomicrobium aquimarinum TaxID=3133971 RepID=UPI0031FEF29C
MLIQTEKTPNPSTRKFLPGRTVMESGGRDFPTPESAEISPLAEAIFATGMVDGVYFGRDFVSVSAAPTIEWIDLEPEVLQILMDHFLTESPLFKPGSAADIHVAPAEEFAVEEDPADEDIIAQIKELIETRVRPAVAQDGGDIVYRGYKSGHVYLALQGACAGCPSSTITLKNGIEGLIKHYVPEVTSVEAI